MTDRITLTGLTVSGRHGVLAAERRDGQPFVVDAVLHLDTRPAATSDDVADTVHYGELADRLAAVVAGEPVNLLETLAARLVEVCLADPRVAAAEVTVHKPHAPIPLTFTDVAVTIRRDRDEGGAVTRAVLSIGSNVGDRLAHLAGVVSAADPVAVSPVYQSAPWGPVPQDDYLNAVLVVDDPAQDARGWLAFAAACERAAGRVRGPRWGPRTLDVDIVQVLDGGVPVGDDSPELTLPHPRAHHRAFVLVPWLAVEPDAVLAGRGPVAALLAALDPDDRAGVRRRDDLSLEAIR